MKKRNIGAVAFKINGKWCDLLGDSRIEALRIVYKLGDLDPVLVECLAGADSDTRRADMAMSLPHL